MTPLAAGRSSPPPPPVLPPAALQGKTQLVRGKLQTLPEDLQALTLSLNYYTEVAAFQKVGPAGGDCREH